MERRIDTFDKLINRNDRIRVRIESTAAEENAATQGHIDPEDELIERYNEIAIAVTHAERKDRERDINIRVADCDGDLGPTSEWIATSRNRESVLTGRNVIELEPGRRADVVREPRGIEKDVDVGLGTSPSSCLVDTSSNGKAARRAFFSDCRP